MAADQLSLRRRRPLRWGACRRDAAGWAPGEAPPMEVEVEVEVGVAERVGWAAA